MRPIALLIWVIIIAPLVWCLYREHTEDDQEPKPRLAIPILELGRWVIEYIENAASDSDTSQHLPAAVFQLPGIHIKFTYIAPPGRGIFDRFSKVSVCRSLHHRKRKASRCRGQRYKHSDAYRSARRQTPKTPSSAARRPQSCGRNKRPSTGFVVSGSNPNTAEQADDRHDIRCNDLYPFKHISSSREHKK